jgi:pilus assembly protein Flp/PilA
VPARDSRGSALAGFGLSCLSGRQANREPEPMGHLRKLLADNRGASAIEYALIASLISVAAITSYYRLGQQVGTSFNDTAEKIASAGE